MKKNEKGISSLRKKTPAASRTKRTVMPKKKTAKRNPASQVISFPRVVPVPEPLTIQKEVEPVHQVPPLPIPIINRSITIRDAKKLKVMLLCDMNEAWNPSTEIRFRHSLRMLFKEMITMKIDDNLMESLSIYQPDLLLVIGNRADLPIAKDSLPLDGLTTVLWLHDVHEPISLSENSPNESSTWDLVITQNQEHAAKYQKYLSSRVIYLPFGTDPELYSPEKSPDHLHSDLLLLGDYEARLAPYLEVIQSQNGRIRSLGENWEGIPGVECWEQESDQDLSLLYNGANMVVSFRKDQRHRFDIAACGGFLLAEQHANLHVYMSPGDDVVSFQTPEELGAHLAYYKEHPEEKRKIASSALARSEFDYSFFHLMMDFTNAILESK